MKDPVAERRRLLIIAAYFPPMGGGGVLRMTKLAKYLPALGWDVTVVCSDERAPEIVDASLLAEVPPEVRVVRVRGPLRSIGTRATLAASSGSASGSWLVRRLTGAGKTLVRSVTIPDRWLGWAWKVSRLDTETLGHPDVILSSGPPHSAHLAAARLSSRLRVPFVLDLRDDWAENPLHTSPLPWHDPAERRIEKRTLARSNRTVVVSQSSADGYRSRRPSVATRVTVIENGCDPLDVPGRVETGITSAPVRFLHAGTLRGRRSTGRFFDAFGLEAMENPGDLSLQLLGFVSPEHLRAAEAAIPAGCVEAVAPVAHAHAVRLMGHAGVLVLITSVAEAGANTMTGKIYEYLAVRRPILLVGPEGPAADLVRSSGAGIVADPEDVEAMRTAIRDAAALARDPSFAGASDDVLARFDRRRQAERWSELLADVIAGGPRP